MTSMTLDSTHTIRYENRGLKLLVGIVCLWLLVRLWWIGWFSVFSVYLMSGPESEMPSEGLGGALMYTSSEGLGYGVGLLLGVVVELVMAIGGAAIWVFSGLQDFVSQEYRSWKARSEATAAASNAALIASSSSSGTAAGTASITAQAFVRSGESSESPLVLKNGKTFGLREAFEVASGHERRLKVVEAKTEDMEVPPPPAPPKTMEELVKEQGELIEKLLAEKTPARATKTSAKTKETTNARR